MVKKKLKERKLEGSEKIYKSYSLAVDRLLLTSNEARKLNVSNLGMASSASKSISNVLSRMH